MHFQRLVVCASLATVTLGLYVSLPQQLQATNFNWNKPNGCGIFSCNFFDAGHWSPGGGPPGTGDFATINMNGGVHLTQNSEVLDNLTLQTSTSFRTFGHRLNVSGSPGNLFMFGTGSNGSTVLRVDSGGGFQVIVDTLSLHQGAQVNLLGGKVLARFRMLISRSSLISGNGTLGLTADDVNGALQVAGTIRPNGGNIAIVSSGSTYDLDGNIAGEEPGFLDITSTGSLFVNGVQDDPFSGRLHVGNGQVLDVNSPWSIDGELRFFNNADNRLDGPSFSFLSGAQVTTNNSTGRVIGPSTWANGASLELTQAANSLRLEGDSTIASGVTISGEGQLINTTGATMSLDHGANVGAELFNQSLLTIGNSPGQVSVGDFTQNSGGTLQIELGGTQASDYDALHILGDGQLAGNLAVGLLSGFTLGSGQQFKIMDIDGTSSGQFAGLAEGATVGSFGEDLMITYAGGDGNDVVLYTAGLPGDFDLDNDVDGADFLVWQRGQSPNPLIPADLSLWQSNYGATAPLSAVSAAVPEPSSLWLAFMVGLVCVMVRIIPSHDFYKAHDMN